MEEKTFENQTIIASVEQTEKGMRAVASTSTLDRQGESIDQNGWNLKNFKKNPVLLWAHNHDEPPIGTAKNIKVEGEGKKARLTFEPVFHEITERAKAVKQLFAEGIMNSFSVGFIPVEAEGNTFTKAELLEISAVGVPANPEARTMAYKSLAGAGFGEDTIKEVGVDDNDIRLAKVEAELAVVREQVNLTVKGLQSLNPSGRSKAVVEQRLALSKVIARASDQMLGQKSGDTALLKVVKRSAENLIADHKQEISNGQNKRTSR